MQIPTYFIVQWYNNVNIIFFANNDLELFSFEVQGHIIKLTIDLLLVQNSFAILIIVLINQIY